MADNSNPNSTLAPDRAAALMRSATYASVAVATILIAAKFSAWVATESVSLLSSLIDSVLDAGASLINLLAVRHALTPPDREHRFGHGKAEPLAGLAQSAFIAGSGVFLVLEAIDRFISPHQVVRGDVGIAVMALSVLLTVALVAYQAFVVRKTKSVAVAADSVHYRADIMVNLAIVLSLFLSTRFGLTWADPLFALGVVGYMAWGAVTITRQSMDYLMDREFPDEDRAQIRAIAMAHHGVLDVHDMRTRSSGPVAFIQLHIEMDRNLSLLAAHEIADEVMCQIETAFPRAEVLVHMDPEGVEERRDDVPRPERTGN
jgi:ferrous-iron efflux pump FieF